MTTRAFAFANLIGGDNKISVESLPSEATEKSTASFESADALPLSGNNVGDQAFVQSTNRLYIWNGSGWYNIALINTSPTLDPGGSPDPTYELDSNGGTPITIQLSATDPEGLPITYSAIPSDSAQYFADIVQNNNEFIISAKSTEIIQQYDSMGGAFSITFKASDGVNLATALSEFRISFSAPGEALFTSLGSRTWIVPDNVENISVVCIGGGGGGAATGGGTGSGGGGGGGGLGWKNNISVTPGDTVQVVVGAGGLGAGTSGSNAATIAGADGQDSYIRINNITVCAGYGGKGGTALYSSGGGFVGDGGGTGGAGGGMSGDNTYGGGGGGAGGYTGNGGNGGRDGSPTGSVGQGGAGGGGGARNISAGNSWGGNGGGTHLYGEGTSGAAGSNFSTGGAGSADAGIKSGAIAYGGGGRGSIDTGTSIQYGGDGYQGGVRIVWGTGRQFPSSNVDYNSSASETVI